MGTLRSKYVNIAAARSTGKTGSLFTINEIRQMHTGPPTYTKTAALVHWLTALLVFGLLGLGWFMVDLPKGPARGDYFALHKSIGLCAFTLVWLRVAWRSTHRPPPLPATVPPWQAGLARTVHFLFYVLLIVQPVSGYLSSSFSGYRTSWFGLPLPHWAGPDAPLNELFTEIHVIGSIALVVLVSVHVLGAISHVLAGDMRILRRMWPWGRGRG